MQITNHKKELTLTSAERPYEDSKKPSSSKIGVQNVKSHKGQYYFVLEKRLKEK